MNRELLQSQRKIEAYQMNPMKNGNLFFGKKFTNFFDITIQRENNTKE